MDVKYVFTLVHGTKPFGSFQKPPAWIACNSGFSSKLKEHFHDKGGAKTFPFEWTGWNQVGARSAASDDLREKLLKRFDEFPTAQHYLICHSHGGNVAMHALLDENLKKRIEGVACLATPFLSARNRELGWTEGEVAGGAIVVLLVALIVILINTSIVGAVVLACLLGGVGVVAWRSWRDKIERLKEDLKSSPPTAGRLLIVRSPADEASLLLAFSQFMSWITVKVLVTPQGWYVWFKEAVHRVAQRKALLAVAALLGLGATVGFAALIIMQSSPGNLAIWPAAAMLGSLVLFAVSACLLWPVKGEELISFLFFFAAMLLVWPVILLLSLILLIPFGPAIAFGNILLEVSAESTPGGGPWTVHLVEPSTTVQNQGALRHSVYDNSEVQKKVCEWVDSDYLGSCPG